MQAAGNTVNQVRTQIKRHAKADKRSIWGAGAPAGKGQFDGRYRRDCVPFLQYKAKVPELVGATQDDGSRMGAPKQEEALEPSRELGRGAMKANAAQHPDNLKQRRARKISGNHKELASARTSIDNKLRVNVPGQIKPAIKMQEVSPTMYPVQRHCPRTSTSGASSRKLSAAIKAAIARSAGQRGRA